MGQWTGSHMGQWTGSHMGQWTGSHMGQWTGSHMGQWTGSILVGLMACHLFSTKPLPESCQQIFTGDPKDKDMWNAVSKKFTSKKGKNWKCHLILEMATNMAMLFRLQCIEQILLKWKCFHFDEIFITGYTESCQNDNFQCSQWWKFHQNENISISSFLPVFGCRSRWLKVDSRFAPSQWAMSLQSNTISHWLSTNLESSLGVVQCLVCDS